MFLKDKRVGDEGEERVSQFFRELGYSVEKNKGKNIKYDLQCTCPQNSKFTVEVKNDVYAARSGNLAIEFFNSKSNKASGLMATDADFWVHLACSKIFFCFVSELKDFVSKNTPDRVIEKGGDGNASIMLYVLEAMCPPFQELEQQAFLSKLQLKQ